MSDSRFAIIDPAAGVSGDMLLGALVAAGASPAWLAGLPARLGCRDVSVEIESVDRCGLQAVKVNVRLPGGAIEGPGELQERAQGHEHALGHEHGSGHEHNHEHGHSHEPQRPHEHPHEHHHPHHHDHSHGHVHGPHRHIGDLIAMIERADLSPWVKERAVRAFQLLGEAEGRVHGMPPEAVALHEVGAVDALVDIVGAIEGFEQLGIRTIYHRPVAVGDGWVRAAHGTMSVPAPATALLLEGLEIAPNGPVTGEATTPTGAVLLRVLSAGAPPERWRSVSAGNWGAGGRNPPGYPNALRLIVAEPVREAAEVVLVSTDLDDLSPEYLDPLREALFGAGALDVQVWATQAKKGRTGFRVEALAAPADSDGVTEAFFRHSTTAGVRRATVERVTLPRRELRLDAPGGGSVRVKVLETPDGARAKPEYDDVMEAARRSGRPAHEVARELQTRALTLVAAERAAKAKADTTKKES